MDTSRNFFGFSFRKMRRGSYTYKIFMLDLLSIISSVAAIIVYLVHFPYHTKIAWTLLIIAVVLIVITRYYGVFAIHLLRDNIARNCRFFVNGVQAWVYYDEYVFSRIGKYLGTGLCYEAAALNMMVWRDHKNTRISFIECDPKGKKESISHCLFEFKKYGIWWTIDPTWLNPGLPTPSAPYMLRLRAKTVRIVNYDEFWSNRLPKDIYQSMKTPESSYVFHALFYFRRLYGDTKMTFERYGVQGLNGAWPSYIDLIDIYKNGHPLSKRMIREFIARPSKEEPNRKTFRKAKRLVKTRNAAYAAARKMQEETGKIIAVHIKSCNEFEVKETDEPRPSKKYLSPA